ncbi:MAG: RNA polymerase sigma factor [Acidimicrobiia bacterium]|nr:MAG: RNA polymerase sigma factor [Acidimicrobiia bacterium]
MTIDDQRDADDRDSGAARAAAAFERHVLPEVEVLLRVANALTRNHADAEDLVQDTLIRAYRAIEGFDGRHPRAWLLTILRNTHINRNRRRRPELLRDPDRAIGGLAGLAGDDRADGVVDDTLDAAIVEALETLDESFRRVVELVDIDGLTYAEAAAVLDVPTGTVMSRLHRARSRIRDRLDRAGLAPRSPR